MKSILVFILLSLTARVALCEDFRAANFGEACNTVPDREKMLGSLPNGVNSNDFYEYQGIYLDRVVEIIYDCSDGGYFTRGTYMYNFNSIDDAMDFFNVAKPLLIQEFGHPTFDAVLPEHSVALKEIGFAAEDKYMIRWEREGVRIFLSVLKGSNHSEHAAVGIDFGKLGE